MPEITRPGFKPDSLHGGIHTVHTVHTSLQQHSYTEIWVSLCQGALLGSTASLPSHIHKRRSRDPQTTPVRKGMEGWEAKLALCFLVELISDDSGLVLSPEQWV